METYISKDKFQFITDFSKHMYMDVKGNSYELNFNDLTIAERIMLSSYLTLLCSNSDGKTNKKDLYNLIFNFNNKTQRKTSYQDSFIDDLSNFIARQPYYFAFIKSYYNDIENDKTFIYRQQLNHSEMDVLYSLKFQRNYHSLMNVLYIIGVAKQNITTTYLNRLPLLNIYSSSPALGKKRVDEIFNKINAVSKNEVKYKIVDGIVYFGNGFSIDENEEYQSKGKQLFNKIQREESILDELAFDSHSSLETPVVDKKIVPQNPVEEKVEIVKYEEPKNIPSDLSEVHADVFVFEQLLNKLLEKPNYCSDLLEKGFPDYNKRAKFLRFVNKEIGNISDRIREDKDLIQFTNNPEYPFPKDDKNWKDRKDTAKYNIIKLSKPMFKFIEKIYDERPEIYETVLAGIFQTNRSYIKALIYSQR